MKISLLMLAISFVSLPAFAMQTIAVDKATSGSTNFVAIGRPSMLKIKGAAGAPKGEIKINGDKASGELTFQLDDLDTGMSLRNKHMKEKYLETGKFPTAKLTFTDVALPAEFSKGDASIDKLPFKGTLNLHGKDSPVEGTAKVTRKGGTVEVDATMETKTTSHDIATPSFAGITIGENITINVQFTAPIEDRK
jgi:polyisoprenoid-binding protein YceI